MSEGRRRFFSAETESQAVIEAAAHFGLAPGELAYQPLAKKHGFLRRARVVIAVDADNPRRAAAAVPAAAPATRPPVPARPAVPAEGKPTGGARAAAEPRREAAESPAMPEAYLPANGVAGAIAAAGALARLAGLRLETSAQVAAGPEGEEVQAELRGPDREVLVARQGELLRVCEFLLRRMVDELPPGGLSLDSQGFRGDREGTLRRRAAAAAEEVRRSGEPVLFEPLPAVERRIVHLAVQDEPAVASESEGEGELRRVKVFPAPAP